MARNAQTRRTGGTLARRVYLITWPGVVFLAAVPFLAASIGVVAWSTFSANPLIDRQPAAERG
jgi:hypothetical protein